MEWWHILLIVLGSVAAWLALSVLLYRPIFKRFYDMLLSGVAILVLSPLFIILIIVTAIKMGGNPFFVQRRIGKGGKVFRLIKFRSMTNKKDKDGKLLSDDARLTRYGRLLRSTSLDELPELFNIFMGNMAIIGPRPLLVEYRYFYTDAEHLRHAVRPGLTGWAQVNGRSVTPWNERLAQDVFYVNNISLLFDIKIIFKTVAKVLGRSDVLVGAQHGAGHGRLDVVRASMANKLLVLGSDFGTVSIVREAKARGMYVIAADLMESSPTKALADEAWLVSTTDTDDLQRRMERNNVRAIISGASDFNINNGRTLAKRLGLPMYCQSDMAWSIARDKSAFKQLCKQVGAPVATDYILTDELAAEQLDAVVFPVVVKPADKSGNRGMSYCKNKDELVAAYKKARQISNHKRIIVERQLVGEEYNVHYALAGGKAKLLYFSATLHGKSSPKNMYSFKCTTARRLKQYMDEVNNSAVAVLEAAECREGIAWFDIMRDEDGRFYLLEMGYRFGGVMTYVPYERVSGFNTVGWMLDCATGIEHGKDDLPGFDPLALNGCAASYHLFAKRDGKISSFSAGELEGAEGVWLDLPKREGASVRKDACMGLVGIYASDMAELKQRLELVNSQLSIEDERGEEMFVRFDGADIPGDLTEGGAR